MKAEKTKQLVNELVQIAFGNMELDNKRIHEMCSHAEYEMQELERLAEIGKQVEFEEEQGKKYANNIYAKGSHIPNGCYINYGKDLDGCSTQQNEGCSRCVLFRSVVK
jgi:regulator of replication initiation timing